MTRPNIIHILVDDLGYGDFSYFNNGLSETPCLDQLIKESLCLDQHYTSSPVCNPSRASLLTGRYPQRTGSIDTLEWRGLERMDLSETTIADILGKAGYRTGLIGKWHLGAFDPRYKPENRGFDEAICFRGGMHDYYDWRLESGNKIIRTDGRYLTEFWTDEAIDFLKRSPQDPFYLHLTYNAPHTPLQAPEEDMAVFRNREDLSEAVKTLYAMVRNLDRNVGRLLEQLETQGLRDNTLVIFSSDNGPQFGCEAGSSLDRFNCQLHGSKGSTYEGGIRVPAIIRWPDGLDPATADTDGFFHMCDWLPTILGFAGIDTPHGLKLDGVDQSSILRGNAPRYDPLRCWQWNRYEPRLEYNAAIRDGDWKLVRPYLPEAFEVPDIKWLHVSMYEPEYFIKNGIITDPAPHVEIPAPPPVELYNIKNDPLEQHNLAEAQPQQVQRMDRELSKWFEDVCKDLAKTRRE
ncbi:MULTISPECIES: sulfatase-like hydrolase/transferase [unclassified Lentimonas]|uniref:sulfatase-like hydrolase/transferase n=1 Tax=unclassified Lentimonas TaxID=2630993 RepID=UPI00132BB78C|nr:MULTISPECIES: sulfatase-like hydrolase/transferase [unclassified Lentimonas]CAA6679910.1 Choline-sulfatase (EC [Lentimonas sp. CC4]CAA6683454.1 Choline-sulfatase (EC [Lentimonas sp. CC6]CAA6691293.1 Choline-sulfatase (EC [Lentimonas sp. CC10]CAA6695920.1 Choline-sulfatase (EC [Lentimonas sp. CC19]CAA7068670.1 Choline-sulfatase (EC [Lentimonas sp. CC11]